MKKIILFLGVMFIPIFGYGASDNFYTTSCSSHTEIATTTSAVTITTVSFSFDGLLVTNPGSSSFVEIWDARNSTNSVSGSKYIGKFNTTVTGFQQEGLYGVTTTTGIAIHNQGSGVAAITIFYRTKNAGGCSSGF